MISSIPLIFLPFLLSLATADITPICDEIPAGHIGWGDKDNFAAAKQAVSTACKFFKPHLEATEYQHFCVENPQKNSQFVFWVNNDLKTATDVKEGDCEAAMNKIQTTCHFGGRSANLTDLYWSTYPSWGKCNMGPDPEMSWTSHSLMTLSSGASVHARDAVQTGSPDEPAVPTAETTLDPDDAASILWRRLHPEAKTSEEEAGSAEPAETGSNFWRRLIADEHPDI